MSRSIVPIRVAVVEDKADDRNDLIALISSDTGLECVAACRTAAEAIEILPRKHPHVILMDIQLPGASGIICVSELQPVLPDAQIMMLTVVEDHDLIFRSLAVGATGYLLKKTPPAKVLEAIRELHEGGAPMSGQIARQVVSSFRQPRGPGKTPTNLSPTEQAVLKLLAKGFLYKEVADKLTISPSTVRTHVWHIYRKLHVHNRTEAVLKARSR
jgi:DNA-binding NarL/FixJ family response regulator